MISFGGLSHNPLRDRNHYGKKKLFGEEVRTFFRALNLQNELSKELKTTTNHRISCSNCIWPCLSNNNKNKCAGLYPTKRDCRRRLTPEEWLAGHITARMPTTPAKFSYLWLWRLCRTEYTAHINYRKIRVHIHTANTLNGQMSMQISFKWLKLWKRKVQCCLC